MSTPSTNLGRLPNAHKNDTQERQSLAKFCASVPLDRFIVRHEPISDKGVDLSLELIVEETCTNFRSQIQLKSHDSDRANVDGTISYKVDTSNINYLLNGNSPLYVLWIVPKDELRYLWVRDIAAQFEKDKPNWREQESVTLRFKEQLNELAWSDIHNRIRQESQLQRTTHDVLLNAASSEPITISISPDDFSTTTPDQAYDWITKHGVGLISAGYAKAVKHWVSLLSHSKSDEPVVQLTVAFAYFTSGDHFTTRGYLGRAFAHRNQLSSYDRYFFDFLFNECEHLLGEKTHSEYLATRLQIESAAPQFLALQLRLDHFHQKLLGERDRGKMKDLIAEIRIVFDQIQELTTVPDPMKLQIDLVKFYVDSNESLAALLDLELQTSLRRNSRTSLDEIGIRKEMLEAISIERRCRDIGNELLSRARQLGHPMIIANAIIALSIQNIIRVESLQILSQINNFDSIPIPTEMFQVFSALLIEAVDHYTQIDCISGQTSAILLLAQWLHLNGRHSEAKPLLEKVISIGRGMGYRRKVDESKAMLEGKSLSQRLRDQITNPPDADVQFAKLSLEKISNFAQTLLTAHQLPDDRFPILLRACMAMQDVARMKIAWCQHIELMDDSRHTLSPDTYYRTDPERKALCTLHKLQSIFPHTDTDIVLAAFKSCNCVNCPDRSPKSLNAG